MRRFPVTQIAIAGLIGLLLPAAAATETVLYSFPDSGTAGPLGSLFIRGASLYGTAVGDPRTGNGQVFELTNKGGSWTATSLLTFDGTDGSQPYAGLVRDAHGVFYGTTEAGGTYNAGTVFALSKSGGKWVEKTIWAFGGAGDGAQPQCDLVIDKSGNLLGTTYQGGTHNVGTVFELSNTGGVWTETVLHSFEGKNGDGWNPYAGLLMAGPDIFYGTTTYGGDAGGHGTVFKLSESGGVWTETVIFAFDGADGYKPLGRLIMDKNGALFGTTYNGGVGKDFSDVGVVFKLKPSGSTWTESVLHAFGSFADDGENPIAGLTWGPSGTLYGTTPEGGCPGHPGVGTVFKLTPRSITGVWKEAILHCFTGDNGDGSYPQGGVALDRQGALYGTTMAGGTSNLGAVWEIVP